MNFATVPFLRSPDIIASGPKCGYHHCFVRVLSLFNSLRHCQCSLSGLSSVSLYWWGFVCKSATYGMLHLGHLKVSHLYINNFKIIFQQSDCLHYKSSPLILLLDSLCWIIHRGFVELISILSSHLPLCFPSDLFPDLLRSRCYIYALSPPMCAACSTTPTLFDLVTLMRLVKNAIYEAFQCVIISISY